MNGKTVKIIETQEFIDSSSRYLSDPDIDAIRHLLAAKPAAGEIFAPETPQLLTLSWRGGALRVIYMLSHDIEEIYLVVVISNDPGDGGPGNGCSGKEKTTVEKTKSLLKTLAKLGIGVSIKELLDRFKGE